MRLGKGSDRMAAVTGAREAEELSDAMAGMLEPARRGAAGDHEFAAGRPGLRGQRRARAAHAADRDARRPRHAADPRSARRGTRRGGRRPGARAAPRRGHHHRARPAGVGSARAGRGPRADRRHRHARPGGAGERARRRDVEIVVQSDDDIGTIWGWPGGLRLAVDNLVRNAVAHGGATTIVLTARRHAATDGAARCSPSSSTTTAAGCPPRSTSSCMGRFARGSTAAPGGSGLGLALVAQQAAAARRRHRAVRRPARRVARDLDGVDFA